MNEICSLALDSRLANAKIGKIVINDGTYDLPQVKRFLKQSDLVFIFSRMDPELLSCFSCYDWVFAGVKLTFNTKLSSLVFPKVVLSSKDFFGLSDKRELLFLARDLFTASRFYMDPHIHRLGKNVYIEWIKNSMSGQAADAILVCRNSKGSAIGFITVKKKKGFIEPVLVKVSPQYQGKGYGKKLMHQFFNYAASEAPGSSVIVNAMLNNTNALNFYHSFGLKVKDHQYVYHVYPQGFRKF